MLIAQEKNPKIFGHRGCRGLLPENTITAFNKAIELGVDGIEWDVVVNKNNELIISHEPVIDASYCYDKEGKSFSKSEEKKYNIYQMTSEEVKAFDCGSKPYPKFPEQAKIKSYKPTLQEAFASIQFKPTTTILFEIKSVPAEYGSYQPTPEKYARIIANEIEKFQYKENIIFMCFDAKMLEAMHQLLPNYRYVYLTYLPLTSATAFLNDLSFTPYALGMLDLTITKKIVTAAHEKNVKVFAWTVNKIETAEKLKRKNVDGLITDYPDRIK